MTTQYVNYRGCISWSKLELSLKSRKESLKSIKAWVHHQKKMLKSICKELLTSLECNVGTNSLHKIHYCCCLLCWSNIKSKANQVEREGWAQSSSTKPARPPTVKGQGQTLEWVKKKKKKIKSWKENLSGSVCRRRVYI